MRIVIAVLSLAVCLSGVTLAQESPRQELSLNGLWDFYPDGGQERHDIRVPSFWDAPQDYGYPIEWLHMRHGIYRKSFTLPESMRDKEIFLQIARVSVIAKVFINGQQAGAEDSGGYLMMQLPYQINLTPHLRFDAANQLEVRVWGGKSMIHGTESQDDLIKEDDFPADTKIDGRFLYPYCVDHWDGRRGLNGDVSLLALPKVHIAEVFITPQLHKNADPADDELQVRVTLANRDTQSRKVRVQSLAALTSVQSSLALEPMTVTLPAGSTIEILQQSPWPNAAYWWPHDPKLYHLDVTLWQDKKTVDRQTIRFGFRQSYVDGPCYKLNGIRANFRGDAYEFSWHEGFRHGPSTAPVFSTKELILALQQRLVREYQQLNHNMLRPHKASGIDALYDTCDEIGMMVFDEAPFWETWVRTDERAKTNFEAWIKRWIKARYNHPSIVAWIGSNECWYGPTGAILLHAVRAADTSRPSFNEDPWGPNKDSDEPFEGDAYCRHYSGGYPIDAFNTANLYDVYQARPDKPTGEGESLFADGFPLFDEAGALTAKRSARGEFGHPDMISQGQWIQGVCRLFRAMRYAGISDARLYASWMYAFDPIEADFTLQWDDLATPGIKPLILRRPIVNIYSDRYPAVRHSSGYDYYRNSFSPVAVFDKDADQQNRIGVNPPLFQPGQTLNRTLAIYNDEFTQGETIDLSWTVAAVNPQDNATQPLAGGTCSIPAPYGQKQQQAISLQLPANCPAGSWLNLTLIASKAGQERFRETTRLGAITSLPAPKLAVTPDSIDLTALTPSDGSQWHLLRLHNLGGGLSEKWSLTATNNEDDILHFNLTAGNLRGQQEIYFQVKTGKLLPNRDYQPQIHFTAEHGSTAQTTINIKLSQ